MVCSCRIFPCCAKVQKSWKYVFTSVMGTESFSLYASLESVRRKDGGGETEGCSECEEMCVRVCLCPSSDSLFTKLINSILMTAAFIMLQPLLLGRVCDFVFFVFTDKERGCDVWWILGGAGLWKVCVVAWHNIKKTCSVFFVAFDFADWYSCSLCCAL